MENQNKLQVGDVVTTKSRQFDNYDNPDMIKEPYMTISNIDKWVGCTFLNPLTAKYEDYNFNEAQLVKVDPK